MIDDINAHPGESGVEPICPGRCRHGDHPEHFLRGNTSSPSAHRSFIRNVSVRISRLGVEHVSKEPLSTPSW
jgi:hypothetical protein